MGVGQQHHVLHAELGEDLGADAVIAQFGCLGRADGLALGAQILAELGVQDMVLLTNTHHTLVGLDGYGLSIVGERPIPGTGGE